MTSILSASRYCSLLIVATALLLSSQFSGPVAADIVQGQATDHSDSLMIEQLKLLEPETFVPFSDVKFSRLAIAQEEPAVANASWPGLKAAPMIAVPEPTLVLPAILVSALATLYRRPRRNRRGH